MDSRFKISGLFEEKQNSADNQTKNQIISQLKVLKVSDQHIQKILTVIDNMPASSHVLGAVKFLTELTNKSSVCEDYYLHSDYIAEYFCTLSNLGFFAVAYYFNDHVTLLAATFSVLSHAIPLKRLNELDKLAAIAVFLNVINHYELIMSQPEIIAAGVLVILTAALDILHGRKNKEDLGPTFHVMWHIAAAYGLATFHQALSVPGASELQTLGAVLNNR